ncbi:hypothetical protein GCM10027425_33540 [Alteromonas gracilis]
MVGGGRVSFVVPQVPEGKNGGLLSVQELAAFLAIGPQTLRSWCAREEIPHGRIGDNIRFDRDQIQAWLDERWFDNPK